MITVALSGLLIVLALLTQAGSGDSSSIHAPDFREFMRVMLRWFHFLGGITWVGLLYFFNLVNVDFMKALDAPTKSKVIPELMPRALWYFRWGSVVTVIAGLGYYAMYILRPDAVNAGLSTWGYLGRWFAIVMAFYAFIFVLLRPITGALNKGPILSLVVGVLLLLMSALIIRIFSVSTPTGPVFSNKSLSIGIGGALGIIMLLNVWGIIWRAQKRIIAWTKENGASGAAMPAELTQMGRRAFLASRMNTWLSLPMLFFMAASHGDYIWYGPK